MRISPLLNKPFSISIAVFLLACSLALPHQIAVAQNDEASATLRERIKQRVIDARKEWQAAGSDGAAKPGPAGSRVYTITHDGLPRTYRVHVPKRYNPATPAALLLAFHGGGGDMDYMATDSYYGLISKSEAEGFVVVFPNGYSQFRSGKFATWNAGTCCASARDQNIDDVGFVRKMISNLTGQLNINRKQIFATGMSNGGMMAYRLGCEMPETFKAIAAIAGTDNTRHCTPAAPISVLHIHAVNDERVLFNGGAGQAFRAESKVTHFTSVPDTIAKWRSQNKCHATPQRVLETPGAYCEKYAQCQGNTALQLCVTEAGGHSWPGGTKLRGHEPPSQALSANDVMWAFFTSSALASPKAVE